MIADAARASALVQLGRIARLTSAVFGLIPALLFRVCGIRLSPAGPSRLPLCWRAAHLD
jgi:hypothetical protein